MTTPLEDLKLRIAVPERPAPSIESNYGIFLINKKSQSG